MLVLVLPHVSFCTVCRFRASPAGLGARVRMDVCENNVRRELTFTYDEAAYAFTDSPHNTIFQLVELEIVQDTSKNVYPMYA